MTSFAVVGWRTDSHEEESRFVRGGIPLGYHLLNRFAEPDLAARRVNPRGLADPFRQIVSMFVVCQIERCHRGVSIVVLRSTSDLRLVAKNLTPIPAVA